MVNVGGGATAASLIAIYLVYGSHSFAVSIPVACRLAVIVDGLGMTPRELNCLLSLNELDVLQNRLTGK